MTFAGRVTVAVAAFCSLLAVASPLLGQQRYYRSRTPLPADAERDLQRYANTGSIDFVCFFERGGRTGYLLQYRQGRSGNQGGLRFSRNVPNDLAREINNLTRVRALQTAAIAPDGSYWCLVFRNGRHRTSVDTPKNLQQNLQFNSNNRRRIKCIALGENRMWATLSEGAQGKKGYLVSTRRRLSRRLTELEQDAGVRDIWWVAARSDNHYVILHDFRNTRSAWKGRSLPNDLVQRLDGYVRGPARVQSVSFAPRGAWLLLEAAASRRQP